ncbi:alpha/beta fold hydrolase [Colwellia hornerae]|uniref:Alpha/beta fold hydrolase n=1 Tax=Colwellia hornerae TaxID=89402 RepID=A0A5C6QIF2_9GAMM|nr:alpha/beta fold hydrolase [Colwellia hornerae]TWX52464.1 alpha/beta fold hydrolase [Colwellia hornerae]TWX58293.1 alpha/beta fold hydrolase [Colwellia hornerae]TWX68362.1 alpha/beta fold hydrolase [Colwellia hornerae]
MALAKITSNEYGKEGELTARLSTEIKLFWQQGNFSFFSGVDKIRINYATFIHPQHQEDLVLVSGRSESYLKYQELAFDLYCQGYNVFIVDHRGQGLSERLLSDGQRGYVKKFDDYAEDLKRFIDDVVIATGTNSANNTTAKKPHLLAHSMGGAIAVRMMQLYPLSAKSAVLTSPMIAVNNGNIANWLAKGIIYLADLLDACLSTEANYFIGQKSFNHTPFTENELSQSSIRYQVFVELYQKNKEIQLGGVTTHWLKEALVAKKNIFANLAKMTTPILVMQSGKDTIVCNKAQDAFCQQLHQYHRQSCPEGKPFTVDNALHELMFEQDQYRRPALIKALAWFNTHAT